jgi:TolB protein
LPIFLALAVSSSAQQSELGEFEAQSDVGDVRHKGSVRFDAAKKEYQINASGENMWQDKDALHFVWRRLSGDLLLSTRVSGKRTGAPQGRLDCPAGAGSGLGLR